MFEINAFQPRRGAYVDILTLLVALLFALVCFGGGARADYKLAPGDTVGLTVLGFPDLSSTAIVDSEGHVVLPLIGDIKIGGLSITESTLLVQSVVPHKELNRHLEDGRTMPILLSASQVNLSLTSYRPVYISGSVAKPGELAFRPGLTLRQAIALAGGLDFARIKTENPILQISDLKAEFDTLAVEHVTGLATIARLEAELSGRDTFDIRLPDGMTLSRATVEKIVATERRQLKLRIADAQKEKVFLNAATQKETRRGQALDNKWPRSSTA